MKKIMWGIAFLSLIGTVVALSFLPDQIPVHFDFAGNADRIGSKYESLIFPVLIIVLTIFTGIQAGQFEKKAAGETDEKRAAAAGTNARVIGIVGVATAVVLTLIQGVILYNAFRSGANAGDRSFGMGSTILILVGALLVVTGGLMTKTRPNGAVGIRTKWSLYNDNTWEKSNRFGGSALIAAGALTILAALFVNNTAVISAVIAGTVLLAVVSTTWYSRRVYLQEVEKKG